MPQPVDMQSEVMRTMLAERLQEAARAQLAALELARRQEEAARLRRETQVTETGDADGEHMPVRERKHRQGSGRHGKRRPPRDPDDHRLDVSV
jgi:hypothetical protein